jgi:hypothetical protein
MPRFLAVDRIPALVAQLASEQSALQGALTVRLLVSQAKAGDASGTERQADDGRRGGDCVRRDAAMGAETGAAASVRAAAFRPRDQVLRGGPETVDVEPAALSGLNRLLDRNCLCA